LQIGLQLFYILLLVECIFLAEKLTDILEGMLAKQAGWADVSLLVLYSVPEVFNLAFPIALLIAVYRTLLNGRENREFVVLAGMGIGGRQFIPLMLLLGIVTQLCSLTISSVVEPRAHFFARARLFSVTYQALRGGNASGQFFSFPNLMIYAAPRMQASGDGPLFVEKFDHGTPVQVTAAEKAHLEGPDADGIYTLRLRDLAVVDLGTIPSPNQTPILTPTNNIKVGDYAEEVSLDELLRFAPRGETPNERTSLELLGSSPNSKAENPAYVSEVGTRLARSILCLLAPLVACLALICTNRATQAIVLPGFCALLMGLDIAAATAAKTLAAWGVSAGFLAVGFLAISLMTIVAMIQISFRQQHLLVSPRLLRA